MFRGKPAPSKLLHSAISTIGTAVRSCVRLYTARTRRIAPSSLVHGSRDPITYLRYLCKLSVSLAALVRRLHSNLVVIHEGAVYS